MWQERGKLGLVSCAHYITNTFANTMVEPIPHLLEWKWSREGLGKGELQAV
jgi:hypothetical protein